MNRLIHRYRAIARALTSIGAVVIVVLSVVPAADRPVTGAGQSLEHLSAFGLVAGLFAVGYRLPLALRLLIPAVFCAAVEVLQIPLPSRHARISDFVVDIIASWAAIAIVLGGQLVVRITRVKN